MPLYPASFIDELRAAADIVQVVQEYVSLKQVGGKYKGLCPFHAEKTPSFQVDRDKGLFYCFGCGAGGDVFKFVELQEKVGFVETVRLLAQKVGLPLPTPDQSARDRAADQEREALLRVHEIAARYFQELLWSAQGRPGLDALRARGLRDDTARTFGYGYASAARDGLGRTLTDAGVAVGLAVKSGLVLERDGQIVDRFRNRLMVPICREGGSVVAFGGRALAADQQPKYLNSPETPIYSKSRTLYGLHVAKQAIRKLGYAVLVEGYFDMALPFQAGIEPIVATCGTALTRSHAQLLRRFTSKVVLSFDPDQAGQGAVVKSSDILVQEGFHVNVAELPGGMDPDSYVRREGGAAYIERLRGSRPYLDFIMDRTAARHDFADPESRRAFLASMLDVAARIPEAAERDQFADRLAHRARIGEEVVRQEIRKAAVARRTTVPERAGLVAPQLKPAERDFLAALVNAPAEAMRVLDELEPADLEGLASAAILLTVKELKDLSPDGLPNALMERLSREDAELLTGSAARAGSLVSGRAPLDCVLALRRLRYERERAATQLEIDQLQERGGQIDAARIDLLLARKRELSHRIDALSV